MKTLFAFALLLCAFARPAAAEMGSFWEGGGLFGEDQMEAVPPGISLQQIVSLTSDRDDKVNALSVMLDKSRQVAGVYNQHASNLFDGQNVFWLEEIESADGAVLAVVQGRNALILQGRLDRRSQEGRFKIKYLSNGIFMRYESCDFNLRKNGDRWFVQNAYNGALVTDVRVITHGTGITTLQGLCPVK